MNLFVTGATGFLGSHFVSMALNQGHQVWALRRSTLSKPAISLDICPNWITSTLDQLTLEKLPEVDVLVHLATAGVSPKIVSIDQSIYTNILQTMKLVELCRHKGIKRFVCSGSSHEYGLSSNHFAKIPPWAPLLPLTTYGASKASSFLFLNAFAIQHKLEFFYGRIFTAYGEGQYPSNFWPSLKAAALAGEDFRMTSGLFFNDFIPVESVASHLLQACSRSDIVSGSPLIVNIGSGVKRTLRSFAEEQWKVFGAKGALLIGKIPDRPNQLKSCLPDLVGL